MAAAIYCGCFIACIAYEDCSSKYYSSAIVIAHVVVDEGILPLMQLLEMMECRIMVTRYCRYT